VSTPAAVAYAVAAGAYAGFQLTVRFVVYPQFARVPPDAFAAYERAHQRLITPLVGVLFGAMALTAAACVLAGPRGTGLVAAGLFAALLLVTGAGAVPQHNLLGERFDAGAYRRLLAWDGVRVALALVQVLVGALGVAKVF
jgi:hypothetical protein